MTGKVLEMWSDLTNCLLCWLITLVVTTLNRRFYTPCMKTTWIGLFLITAQGVFQFCKRALDFNPFSKIVKYTLFPFLSQLWMKKYHFCHLHGPPDTTSVSLLELKFITFSVICVIYHVVGFSWAVFYM